MKFRVRELTVKLPEGARRVGLDEVEKALTPPATKTWTPIPHTVFVTEVIDKIFGRDLTIRETFHSLSHANLRYFGMLDVRSKNYAPDHSWIVALVNANDRTEAARMLVGCRLFGSNAIAFSGEVQMSRRHTKDILNDMSKLADEAIEKLYNGWNIQDHRLDCYKECVLEDRDASHLIMLAFEQGIVSTRDLPKVLKTYKKPKDELYRSRTAWSLFNAILVALHELNAVSLIRDSMKLTELFDKQCGFKGCIAEKHVQPELI